MLLKLLPGLLYYWDGESCTVLNHVIHGYISNLIFFNNKLYIGGKFNKIDEQIIINCGYINGSSVNSIGLSDSISNTFVQFLGLFCTVFFCIIFAFSWL